MFCFNCCFYLCLLYLFVCFSINLFYVKLLIRLCLFVCLFVSVSWLTCHCTSSLCFGKHSRYEIEKTALERSMAYINFQSILFRAHHITTSFVWYAVAQAKSLKLGDIIISPLKIHEYTMILWIDCDHQQTMGEKRWELSIDTPLHIEKTE